MTRPWLLLGILLLASCSQDRKPPSDGDPGSVSRSRHMQILAPQPGTRWIEGTRQVIRWIAPGVPRINLGAAVGGKDKGHFLIDASSAPDSLVWDIPIGFVTGFGPDSSTEVRIRLENATDPTDFVEAGPFTIARQAPRP